MFEMLFASLVICTVVGYLLGYLIVYKLNLRTAEKISAKGERAGLNYQRLGKTALLRKYVRNGRSVKNRDKLVCR